MATLPELSANTAQEESRGRISQMPDDMRAAAERAVAAGMIDPADFDLAGDALSSPLESIDNPVGLEAIILLTGRPPMLVQNDRVVIDAVAQNAMGPGTGLPKLNTGVIQANEPLLPSVGRVEFVNHAMQWGGTGWVIDGAKDPARKWVVTNRHVAKLVAQRMRDGSGTFMRSPAGALYGAKVDFGEEHGAPASAARECKVERVVVLADDTEADCALLEISVSASFKPGFLPLADSRAAVGDLVATIGYPAYDSRQDVGPMQAYFGTIYNVKRFAPGLVTQSAPGLLLMHDCTTLGGNSGSPLIDLVKQRVVGLHFSGSKYVANTAVSVETLKQLQTGRLFAVTASSGGEAVAGATETVSDGVHTPAMLDNRSGYDPDFLGHGLAVPVPELNVDVESDLVRPSDAKPGRPYEIRYTHFGVFYSRSRKTPRFTVVNIDGETSVRIKREKDKWFFDQRIDSDLQLGQEYYAGDLDRGHMVRREEPNWGDLARQANDDTFHYTNCGLQHSLLNRGRTLWQGLENYILDSTRTKGFRASVFTGPILRSDDPDLGLPELASDVQIPREFWKVVVMEGADGGLHATAYLLSQGDLIRELLEKRSADTSGGNEAAAEGFELGAYRTFQVSLKHIEEATGLTWTALAGADPMAAVTDEAVSVVTYLPIDSRRDLIL